MLVGYRYGLALGLPLALAGRGEQLLAELELLGADAVLEVVAGRSADRSRLALVNADAMVDSLGPDDARTVRHWQESRMLREEDLTIHVHNPRETSDEVSGFYTTAAEQVIRTFLDPRVWVVGIDLRLHFHVDRRPELRLVVDDFEAVLVDAGVFGSFECLFIHRNDLATRAVT